MHVVVSKLAIKKYRAIKEYIVHKWGLSVAGNFEQKVKDFLPLLENFPEIGTMEFPNKQIRGFQLTKQTKVFYRIKGERIIILNFFDVRQSPGKKLK